MCTHFPLWNEEIEDFWPLEEVALRYGLILQEQPLIENLVVQIPLDWLLYSRHLSLFIAKKNNYYC